MTLKEFGLIETTENNTTTFKTLKSSNDRLNVLFDFTKFNTVSELEYALYAIILIEKIRNKEYIKKELERLKKLPKPKDSKESTKVKKEYKKFKKIFYKHKMPSGKPITDEKYDEYGISLSTITKLLGVAREKAHKIVEFAIRHNLITKKNESNKYSYMVSVEHRNFGTKNTRTTHFAQKTTHIRFMPMYIT